MITFGLLCLLLHLLSICGCIWFAFVFLRFAFICLLFAWDLYFGGQAYDDRKKERKSLFAYLGLG